MTSLAKVAMNANFDRYLSRMNMSHGFAFLDDSGYVSEEFTGELTLLDGPQHHFEFALDHDPSSPITSFQREEGRIWLNNGLFEFDVRTNTVDAEQYAPIRSENPNLNGYQVLPSVESGDSHQPLHTHSVDPIPFLEQQYNDANPDHLHQNFLSIQTNLDTIDPPGLLNEWTDAPSWSEVHCDIMGNGEHSVNLQHANINSDDIVVQPTAAQLAALTIRSTDQPLPRIQSDPALPKKVAIPKLADRPFRSRSATYRPFQCEDLLCKKSFSREADLKRHRDTVHEEADELFLCEGCGYSTRRHDKLAEHLKRVTHFAKQRAACGALGC